MYDGIEKEKAARERAKAWRAGLKVGDHVVITRSNAGDRLATVDHVTEHYVTVGSTRYRRDNGYPAGGRSLYTIEEIREPTQAWRIEHRRKKAWRKLGELAKRVEATDTWNRVPIPEQATEAKIQAACDAIAALFPPPAPAPEGAKEP